MTNLIKASKVRAFFTIIISVLIISTIVYAGSLTPPAAPASTMKTLQEIYDSVAGVSFDSSSITADADGSLIENLKYIADNLFWASSTDDIYTTNSGNVGIGTFTPAEHLEISGTGDQYIQVNSTDGATPGIKLIDTGAGNYDWRARVATDKLYFGYSVNDGSSWYSSLSFSGLQSSPKIRTWSSGADLNIGAGDDLIFQTYGSSWDEKLRILENGYIGIGTSAPSSILHIEASSPDIIAEATGSVADVKYVVKNADAESWAWGIDYSENAALSIAYDAVAVPSLTSDNVFSIDTSGNVGIGDISPDYALDVYGTICQDTDSNDTCDGTVTSDKRLKKNIVPIENALAKVLQLQGVHFEWDRTIYPATYLGAGRQMGMIAQEVEKLFPELVYEDMQGYKMIDYQKITALNIEAIKEQQKEIESLEKRIKEIEEKCFEEK